MKQQYAEILFYLMGTRATPTSERYNFLRFVGDYKNACEKMDGLERLKKYLENHLELKDIYFEKSHNKYEIDNLEAYGHEAEITEILIEYNLIDVLSHKVIYLCDMEKITFHALTRDERDALDMVDNFERNELMDTLGDGTKVRVSKI